MLRAKGLGLLSLSTPLQLFQLVKWIWKGEWKCRMTAWLNVLPRNLYFSHIEILQILILIFYVINSITIGNKRFRCPEALFQPSFLRREMIAMR